jgi:hypothetical protein
MESEATMTAPDRERRERSRTRLDEGTATLLLWGGLLLMLLAPNRWTGTSTIHPWANDPSTYERIAAAAPGLPASHSIANAFSERLAPHYLVGLFADASGLSLHASYRIAALVVIAATLLVAHWAIKSLRAPWWIYAVSVTIFVLAPYSFRDVILSPGSVQDLVFVLGVAIAMLGLLKVRFEIVLAGAITALLGRQTALPVGLAIAIWIAAAPDWRDENGRRQLWKALSVLVAMGAVYGAIKAISGPFSFHFAPDGPEDTIIFSPPGVHAVIAHVARCLVAIVVPGVALATVLGILSRAGVKARELPASLWLSLLIGAAIIAQPLVINPAFPGFSFNEQRLASLGLFPICVALAIALIEAERRELIAPSGAIVAGILAVLFVASLHHIYTFVGPNNTGQFVALQLLAAGLVSAALVYARLTGPDGGAARPSAP